MKTATDNKNIKSLFSPFKNASSLLSPSCDVLYEEYEGDPEADEPYGHGGHHQLLEAAEQFLRSSVVVAGLGGILE